MRTSPARLTRTSRRARTSRCAPQAFTLIELLVVISIIALLIAILLPALAKARVSAQVIVSMSQVRQLMLGMYGYTTDNRDSLPFNRFWLDGQTASSPQGLYWSNKILMGQYVNTPKVFWSPGRQTHGLNMQTIASAPSTTLMAYTGYAGNTAGAMPGEVLPYSASTVYPLKLGGGAAPPPSKHVMFSEQYRAVGTLLADGRDGWYAGFGSTSVTSQKAFCYDGTLVRSYMDGHAAGRDGSDLNWVRINDREGSWTGDGNGAPWYDMAGTDFN